LCEIANGEIVPIRYIDQNVPLCAADRHLKLWRGIVFCDGDSQMQFGA